MYLLDSNILISYLNGDAKVKEWIKSKIGFKSLFISTISKIETLSFPGLTGENLYEAEKFTDLFSEINLFGEIISITTNLKRNTNLSLTDSIIAIAATAISKRLTLVTDDHALAKKVKNFVSVSSLN